MLEREAKEQARDIIKNQGAEEDRNKHSLGKTL
jgi:hypothetical protein